MSDDANQALVPEIDWSLVDASAHRARDVEELAALRFEWRSSESNEVGLSADSFRDAFATWWLDHEYSHVGVIGRCNDAPVAMGWLALVDRVPGPGVFVRRCAYLQSVYVRPPWRQRGYGTLLLDGLIQRARDRELDYVAVHPSAASFSYYERRGFRSTTGVLELDFRTSPIS